MLYVIYDLYPMMLFIRCIVCNRIQCNKKNQNKLGARTLGARSRGSKNVTYRQQTTDKKVNTEPL